MRQSLRAVSSLAAPRARNATPCLALPLEVPQGASYVRLMKKILLLTMLLAAGPLVRAQDAAVDERINKLAGQVQDLADSKEALRKDLDALAKEVRDLRDQASKPNDTYATQDDVKRLAAKLEEIDKKRQDDQQMILDKIAELGKTLSASSGRHVAVAAPPDVPAAADHGTAGTANDKGYYYQIQSGDTLSAIAKAYREKMHLKVTSDDILKANPGLDDRRMPVGKKIFIPALQ